MERNVEIKDYEEKQHYLLVAFNAMRKRTFINL